MGGVTLWEDCDEDEDVAGSEAFVELRGRGMLMRKGLRRGLGGSKASSKATRSVVKLVVKLLARQRGAHEEGLRFRV